ncbi:hypothetical protein B0T19DRAFT_245068 [Cercophora scortea]|uniref:Uncharacterized protein n=1 Tax=Cercophora scortea TaxID=314031 RepID=A0AAE0I8V2_9PEZI|nr:hypothetical protein B0T19DRAFT_245068 [Cercophora scortea]
MPASRLGSRNRPHAFLPHPASRQPRPCTASPTRTDDTAPSSTPSARFHHSSACSSREGRGGRLEVVVAVVVLALALALALCFMCFTFMNPVRATPLILSPSIGSPTKCFLITPVDLVYIHFSVHEMTGLTGSLAPPARNLVLTLDVVPLKNVPGNSSPVIYQTSKSRFLHGDSTRVQPRLAGMPCTVRFDSYVTVKETAPRDPAAEHAGMYHSLATDSVSLIGEGSSCASDTAWYVHTSMYPHVSCCRRVSVASST